MNWLEFQSQMERKGWTFDESDGGVILTPRPGSRGICAADRIRRAWAMNCIESDRPANLDCLTAEDWAAKITHLFRAALISGVKREQEQFGIK